MLQIKTTGVEDYIDGSANIKALIIGGPGAGKTRSSSYWPKPIFLDCENGRGSLADRNMPYVEIKGSKDMLDALEHFKQLERTPKAQRQFQTVVVDTGDSYARLVKDEWLQISGQPTFTGFDAWGYLDTKMQMLFTRLLNLDYNVLALVHHKDKTFKDGDNTVREFTLQLQGAISDQIFNDFGLVGFLGTYWEAVEGEKVQRRGLTFHPTPDKPFLKDRFNVTPKWLPITFTENDYTQLFEAFFNRPEFEALDEAAVVGEIPGAETTLAGPYAPPAEGGALPPKPPTEVPLEKKTKGELEVLAKELGVPFKGNTLKGELIAAIKAKQEAPAEESVVNSEVEKPAEVSQTEPTPVEEVAIAAVEKHAPLSVNKVREGIEADRAAAVDPVISREDAAYAKAHGGELPPMPAPDPAVAHPVGDEPQTVLDVMTPDQVASALGGEVISDTPADTPATQPAKPSTPVASPPASAPQGPSACADCAKDLAEEWNDPSKKDYIRLSFVKHRKYLCTDCLAAAS